ncbi:MAG: oligoendopeptidase F [Candidatus Mcinerneyibacterium aminivorans]|uniref:Oligopeptidase F n=1 Tax=Candidatus Mcinerneyibacterium aminivorans TaxID=2703815 RepID=A0A5D0MHA4_9BACT|nr:MAG: oligoendopeptidase F [Candidatus Mcinerneyibacterium aminivorans]
MNFKKIFLMLLLFLISIVLVYPQADNLDRSRIEEKYKWDLTDIYENWQEWEEDFNKMKDMMNEFVEMKGKLKKGRKNLLQALELKDKIGAISYKVYMYPMLQYDLNAKNQTASAKLQQANMLWSKYNTKTSWLEPEILNIKQKRINRWIKNEPELKKYEYFVDKLFHQQQHVLNEDQEELVSYFYPVTYSFGDIYNKLTVADREYPDITLSNGEKVKLTYGQYSKIRKNDNLTQADRKKAYRTINELYEKNINSFAELYANVCQSDWALSQAKNYKSSLQRELFGNKIPEDVYINLIETVKNHTGPLKKYIKLKKKYISKRKDLKEYRAWDTGLRLTDFDREYPYEKASDWVLKSVEPLGEKYQNKMKKLFNNRWIDVYESKNKETGAYNADVYGVHPYILMNYNDTLDSVFTIAHESGHAMHSLLSNENQPYITHNATIFVSEVASTFNEKMLLDFLLEKIKDPKERIALLRQEITNITGTFYFQTYLADFELQAHKRIEEGKPLTVQTLKDIEKKLTDQYYGDIVNGIEEYENITWAFIDHIYTKPFYVYQYATCFASSAKIYEDIVNGETKEKRAEAREKYLELLKSGGDDYPMKQLKDAGVDLTEKETIMAVINRLDYLVNKLEDELIKLYGE